MPEKRFTLTGETFEEFQHYCTHFNGPQVDATVDCRETGNECCLDECPRVVKWKRIELEITSED